MLTQPTAWHTAATQFTAELEAAAGTLSADVQSHRNALADCARRLGLAEPYVAVPERFRWVHDAYAAGAATSGQSEATRNTNLAAVRAFLRWLDQSSYTGDLRRDWATATTSYLKHLTGKGNAPSSVLRQRSGLNHCATCLGLPRCAANTRGSQPRPGTDAADRPGVEATANGAGRHP